MKLGIGTVQFGVEYGISNSQGKTNKAEAARILETGAANGLRVLDTAALYGDSEAVLGEILPDGHPFRVVTKSCKFQSACITVQDAQQLEQTLHRSLFRLKQSSVYGLLLHSADDLLAEGGHLLMERLLSMKERGLVSKVGVSVYAPSQVEMILKRFSIDLIQVPVSILDQRLIQGGHLSALKAAGVEVHARSAFLQGVLLMDPENLPAHFEPVRPLLRSYHRHLTERGMTPVQAALGFVSALKELDCIVCGFNDHLQLQVACSRLVPIVPGEFHAFAVNDEKIIDPSQWRS